jgi:hypothetical protein
MTNAVEIQLNREPGAEHQPGGKVTSGAKRRAGRPRKEALDLMGQKYDDAIIIGIDPGPRSQRGVRVEIVCKRCGVIPTIEVDGELLPRYVRLSDLQNGHTVSCGCLKVENFNKWVARQASKLDADVVAAIWSERNNGKSRKAVAKARRLPEAVVDAAQRLYQKSLIGDTQEQQSAEEMQGADLQAGRVLREVEERSTWGWVRAGKGRYKGELTRSELRMSDGKLIGSLAGFYQECKQFQEGHDGTMGSSIGLFIALCERTLGNRRDRSEQFREQRHQNEQRYQQLEIQNLRQLIDAQKAAKAA